ncbi:hypothetical protein [Streptomyces venetus]|uniref:hypothetical protein n=1 Tax=Streptomyces venetus TaxID=1701086 RepID=UPI0031F1A02E
MYQLMIEALAKDPKTRALRVRVDAVTFTSGLHARIDYTLFSGDRKVEPDGPGTSVRQGDTWKVSAKTVCSLTKYGDDVPQAPICSEPRGQGPRVGAALPAQHGPAPGASNR